MRPTQRVYTDIETFEEFRLHMDDETRDFSLISDGSEKHAKGTEINGFYLSAHTPMEIKLNNGVKVISLNRGEFYNLKEGEVATHKKYAGFSRFTKI